MTLQEGQRIEVRRGSGETLAALVRESGTGRAAVQLLEQRAALQAGEAVRLFYLGHDTLYSAPARVTALDGKEAGRVLLDLDLDRLRRIQRRRNFRVEATLEVTYELDIRGQRLPAGVPLRGNAHSRNLSAGGMLVALPAPLPPGARLTLRLLLDDGGPDLRLLARVVRSTPRRLSHLVAVEFLEPGEPVRARITRFLLRLQAQRASGQWLPAGSA